MTPDHVWQRAASLAARAHATQVRRDGQTPYFAHPVRVTLTVAVVFGCTDEFVLAAALLHDVIEDTTIDYDEVAAAVGTQIADDVAALSKDMRSPEPEREAAYDAQIAAASWRVRLIKLADVYDNVIDAETNAARSRAAIKARRAMALAAGESELDTARIAVEALLASIDGSMSVDSHKS